jgi:hypothetical protein
MNADQLGQDFDHAPRSNRSGPVNRQAFTRVLIDHRQTLQLLAVGTRIEYEVIRPDVPCPPSPAVAEADEPTHEGAGGCVAPAEALPLATRQLDQYGIRIAGNVDRNKAVNGQSEGCLSPDG